MPFVSKKQRAKFYALKEEGKMSQETIDKWESETPKKIPERSTKKPQKTIKFLKDIKKIYEAK